MSESNTHAVTTVASLRDATRLANISVYEGAARQVEKAVTDLMQGWQFSRRTNVAPAIVAPIAAQAIQAMGFWERHDAGGGKRPIHLHVTGSEGSYMDTFAILDYVRWMKEAGYHVTVEVTGIGGIYQAVLMQAADERVMSPNSYLFLEEDDPRPFMANTGNMDELLEFYRGLERHGWQTLVERSGGKITTDDLTERTGFQRIWRMTAQEALERGLVDKVEVRVPGRVQPNFPVIAVHASDSPAVREKKANLRKLYAEAEMVRLANAVTDFGDDKANRIIFFSKVDGESVSAACDALYRFASRPGSKIEILINSPGGNVVAGMILIETIEELKKRGHEVTTVNLGHAASMAGFLLQCGNKRVMGKNARILIHRASTIFGSGNSQMKDQQEFIKLLEARAMTVMAERCTMAAEELQKKTKNGDWWLTADEAKELGLVDEVR
ncbi:MAG TPA: ATP-dependent Clp protease proteolytic subunit [Candidatus Obscuribacterales bacterium]